MKVSCLLIDLDGTLIDTSMIEELRKRKNWKECVNGLHLTLVYDGIQDMLIRAKRKNIRVGVVTSSVSFYAEAILRYHNLAYDTLVAYHDVIKKKPSPDPYLLAAHKLRIEPENIIGIGDAYEDAISLKAANILAFGAGWSGTLHKNLLWDDVLPHPSALLFDPTR